MESSQAFTGAAMKYTFIILVLTLFTSFSYSDVYKWVDADGKVHFSDKKPEDVKSEEVEIKVNTYTNVTYESSVQDVGNKVVMYSTSWCGYCKKARNYFAEKGISYTEYDIETDAAAKERFDKLGAKGVPVILVGKKRMNGFSVDGFKRIHD